MPGEIIYGGKLVRGRIQGGRLEHGPKAFFVGMSADHGLLCDPDQPIKEGGARLRGVRKENLARVMMSISRRRV